MKRKVLKGNENKYDDMPIKYISEPREQCNQIAKRNAKKALESLRFDCDLYGIDLTICIQTFKQEISRLSKEYEGD